MRDGRDDGAVQPAAEQAGTHGAILKAPLDGGGQALPQGPGPFGERFRHRDRRMLRQVARKVRLAGVRRRRRKLADVVGDPHEGLHLRGEAEAPPAGRPPVQRADAHAVPHQKEFPPVMHGTSEDAFEVCRKRAAVLLVQPQRHLRVGFPGRAGVVDVAIQEDGEAAFLREPVSPHVRELGSPDSSLEGLVSVEPEGVRPPVVEGLEHRLREVRRRRPENSRYGRHSSVLSMALSGHQCSAAGPRLSTSRMATSPWAQPCPRWRLQTRYRKA